MSIRPNNNTFTSFPPMIAFQFGFQPGGNFVFPVAGLISTDDHDYQLIFEIVTLSKIDLKVIQYSNNFMSIPAVFADAQVRESNLQPVAATSIDPTTLDVVIGLIVKEYSAAPCEM